MADQIAPQFSQIPLAHTSALDFIGMARLDVDPEDLTERFGIIFDTTYDDLDYYVGAVVLQNGSQIYLMKYRSIVSVGTDMLLPLLAAEPYAELDVFLARLGMNRSNLGWICEDFSLFMSLLKE